jgi:hypothetical protein
LGRSWTRLACEEDNRFCCHRFLPPNRANPLAGLRFHVNAIGRDPEQFRDPATDRRLVCRKLWPFGCYRAIKIHDAPTVLLDPRERCTEQLSRIGIPEDWGRVGKQLTNIAQSCSPKQRVGDCVQKDVGIAVTFQTAIVPDRDAAKYEPPPGCKAVAVLTESDAEFHVLPGH